MKFTAVFEFAAKGRSTCFAPEAPVTFAQSATAEPPLVNSSNEEQLGLEYHRLQ
jgi:hypothetical protein